MTKTVVFRVLAFLTKMVFKVDHCIRKKPGEPAHQQYPDTRTGTAGCGPVVGYPGMGVWCPVSYPGGTPWYGSGPSTPQTYTTKPGPASRLLRHTRQNRVRPVRPAYSSDIHDKTGSGQPNTVVFPVKHLKTVVFGFLASIEKWCFRGVRTYEVLTWFWSRNVENFMIF